MKIENFSNFTGLYSVSKTIRFSLIPEGKTKENIEKSGILEQDERRAISYKRAKELIDSYHKAYIENALQGFKLRYTNEGHGDSLEEYFTYYMMGNKSEALKKKFRDLQDKLRKQIVDCLTKTDAFKRLFKKELIQQDLLQFLTDEDDRKKIAEFHDFTTYFVGFYENRRNMYSIEPQSTAIAYRLIHENLPKFIDNMQVFEKFAATDLVRKLPELHAEFKESLSVATIEEMFRLGYFSTVLTQKQIDVYNYVIGGKSLDNGRKVQGLNEYINLYNQQQTDRHARLPKFKPLFKQILSDRHTLSWLPEQFETDEEVLNAIEERYLNLEEHVFSGENGLEALLKGIADYDVQHIYVCNDLQLTDISQKIFGDWSAIQRALDALFFRENPKKKRETDEKYEERRKKYFKNIDAFSIGVIDNALLAAGHEPGQSVAAYVARAMNSENDGNLFARLRQCHEEAKELLNTPYPKEKNLAQDKVNVERIKRLMDALKEVQWFVKPLANMEQADKDERFYGDFEPLWADLQQVTRLYNKVRDYMTRKPYSEEKIKLNFENSTLMNGWDVNKERDNFAVILRKGGLYYLAIMDKHHNKVFAGEELPATGDCYEKMYYKLLPDAFKMLPKVFFSEKGKKEFAPDARILDIYERGAFKKGDAFCREECLAFIDFYKASIARHEDWSKFDFHFSPTESYEDVSDFYREVDEQGYNIRFRNVSAAYIDSLVDEGKLYLFRIHNKDFSPYSKGAPNLHTLYWKMVFDERNLADVVYKLNGQAEIFYRKASLHPNEPTHPANLPVKNKRPDAEKKESLFPYDLIKDRRYTVDHFQLHVPLTMNFKSRGAENINPLVNDYLRQADDVHVIGIDRGERHLLYLTLIDRYGRIVKDQQFSLNKVGQTDYHQLLDVREGDRQHARRSWDAIEGIKDLKKGYLSQVVHIVAQMMVKYHAVVALEDLNFGFKRGRQKVEKQVYQQFERMLIEKLNYLVDKQTEADAPGGALKAYQLTGKFESFQKLGKQCGFLFYVPAWNTSKIDPMTGFVNLLDTRYESVKAAQDFFSRFEDIRYNAEKDWFEFTFDYTHFATRMAQMPGKWTLCTWGERIRTFRNAAMNANWDYCTVQLTDEFKRLFKAYGLEGCDNLKEAILCQGDKSFFYSDAPGTEKPYGLLQLLKLTLQMRNSVPNSEIDYLVSPVADADGRFYDSRTVGADLPQNADANGAYNIALKGLWAVRQIQASSENDKPKLAISNKEWLQFVQTKPYKE